MILAVLLLAGSGLGGWYWLAPGSGKGEESLRGSGRIEGDEVAVATKIAGRVIRLHAREGAKVERGALLAALDSTQLQARRDQARAASQAGSDITRREEQEVRLAEHKLEEAELAWRLAGEETRDRIAQAEAAMASAAASLARARAELERAAADARRYEGLLREGGIPQQTVDHARAAERAARADVEAAEKELERAEAGRRLAQSGELAVALRAKEVETARAQLDRARQAVAVAQAQAAGARAQVREAEADLAETRILAPANGTIITRMVEEGEVVPAGKPLLTLVNLDAVYLKMYVPEPLLGKIRLNAPAEIRVDAFPDQTFAARVAEVSQQAEFTPKAVETAEERAKLVFWVKLVALRPDGLLKPGMPAEGRILWRREETATSR
jgi:HlyD family secretion protein